MRATDHRHRDGLDASVVLFDMFGTLVHYEPDRTRLAYPEAYALARSHGYPHGHARFAADWDAATGALEADTAATHREFSMTDAAQAFARAAGLSLSASTAAELGRTFVEEWQRHVVPVDGVAAMLHRLAGSVRLGVVSNTHDLLMVPNMLDAMGVAPLLSLVVLSVEHGVRKPHPSIYARSLGELAARPSEVVFVGDSVEADWAGPRRAGMQALLICDAPPTEVPAADTVRHVVDVEAVLTRRGVRPGP